MPVGVLINCVSVFCGGLVGALLGRTFPEKLKSDLPVLFGFCSIAIGINSIITVHAMTVVVLSILIGFIIGYVLHLEVIVNRIFTKLVEGLNPRNKEMDMDLYITAAVLFCCSGFSWYGAMVEGMAGDSSLLLSKSILDFLRRSCLLQPLENPFVQLQDHRLCFFLVFSGPGLSWAQCLRQICFLISLLVEGF